MEAPGAQPLPHPPPAADLGKSRTASPDVPERATQIAPGPLAEKEVTMSGQCPGTRPRWPVNVLKAGGRGPGALPEATEEPPQAAEAADACYVLDEYRREYDARRAAQHAYVADMEELRAEMDEWRMQRRAAESPRGGEQDDERQPEVAEAADQATQTQRDSDTDDAETKRGSDYYVASPSQNMSDVEVEMDAVAEAWAAESAAEAADHATVDWDAYCRSLVAEASAAQRSALAFAHGTDRPAKHRRTALLAQESPPPDPLGGIPSPISVASTRDEDEHESEHLVGDAISEEAGASRAEIAATPPRCSAASARCTIAGARNDRPTCATPLVHRYFAPGTILDEETRGRWRESLASFSPVYTQLLWCHIGADSARVAEYGFLQIPGVRLREALAVCNPQRFLGPKATQWPPQHGKDVFALKALLLFGGYFVDFDVMWTGKSIPLLTGVVLYTAPEKLLGTRAKGDAKVWFRSAAERGSINFGTIAAEAAHPFIEGVLQAIVAFWNSAKGQRALAAMATATNPKVEPFWDQNQLILQRHAAAAHAAEAAGESTWQVSVRPCVEAYPFPRWMAELQARPPRVMYGRITPPTSEVCEEAVFVNVWDGYWNQKLWRRVTEFVQLLRNGTCGHAPCDFERRFAYASLRTACEDKAESALTIVHSSLSMLRGLAGDDVTGVAATVVARAAAYVAEAACASESRLSASVLAAVSLSLAYKQYATSGCAPPAHALQRISLGCGVKRTNVIIGECALLSCIFHAEDGPLQEAANLQHQAAAAARRDRYTLMVPVISTGSETRRALQACMGAGSADAAAAAPSD